MKKNKLRLSFAVCYAKRPADFFSLFVKVYSRSPTVYLLYITKLQESLCNQMPDVGLLTPIFSSANTTKWPILSVSLPSTSLHLYISTVHICISNPLIGAQSLSLSVSSNACIVSAQHPTMHSNWTDTNACQIS